MLPQKNRLTKKRDFDEVFLKGKSRKGDFLIFKSKKNGLKNPRVGFIVSKKVSNKANVRNKVKRKLRACVLAKLEIIKNPTDIVIIALPSSKNKEFLEMQKAVSDFLRAI